MHKCKCRITQNHSVLFKVLEILKRMRALCKCGCFSFLEHRLTLGLYILFLFIKYM